MKKLLLGFISCAVLCGVAFAQKTDSALQGALETAKEVNAAMKKGEFLPLQLNMYDSFDGEAEKEAATKVADQRAADYKDYKSYYNAAVVWAAAASEEGVDYGVRVSEADAKKAINYATSAIKKSPDAPYMYLLRGKVRFEHSVGYDIGPGAFGLANRKMAEESLKDFEKVAQLNPALAPYGNMAVLAEALGNKDKEAQYWSLQKRQDERASAAAKQAVKDAFRKK